MLCFGIYIRDGIYQFRGRTSMTAFARDYVMASTTAPSFAHCCGARSRVAGMFRSSVAIGLLVLLGIAATFLPQKVLAGGTPPLCR